QMRLRRGQILADTFGLRDAGDISITAPKLTVTRHSVIRSASFSIATGNGGNININADKFTLSDNSAVGAGTEGSGNAGSVSVVARDLVMIGGNSLRATVLG